MGKTRFDETRQDNRYVDPLRRQPAPQRLTVDTYCRLARAIAGRERYSTQGRQRGDQRNLAPTAPPHCRKHRMERVRNAAEIDFHDAVQLVERFPAAIPPQAALNPGIRDHQLERRGAVGVVDPGGNGRRLGNVEASRLHHYGAALAAKIDHRGEPGGISATKRETSSGRGILPGQDGADTAARTGDENGAGIPHPRICTAYGHENIDIARPGIVIAVQEELLDRSSPRRPRARASYRLAPTDRSHQENTPSTVRISSQRDRKRWVKLTVTGRVIGRWGFSLRQMSSKEIVELL